MGELPNDGNALTVSFEPRKVTWVKFVVEQVSSTTSNVGLAEIEVYGRITDVDPAHELRELYSAWADLGNETGIYTDESWAVLQKALAEARLVLENQDATQAMVGGARDNLNVAIDALVKTKHEPVDKDALLTLIASVEELNGKAYTVDSWTALEAALAVAKTHASNDSATQEQVDTAAKALEDAITALQFSASSGQLIEKITITGPSGNSLKKGAQFHFLADVFPAEAEDQTITWTSSNPAILSIDQNGVATAKQQTGTAIITATAANGIKNNRCYSFFRQQPYQCISLYLDFQVHRKRQL